MNNLFPPHKDIHEPYGLKGSTVGREYPEEKAQTNPRAVLKDNNWLRREKTLDLGPEKRAFLAEQIRRDVELLERLNVMDYSLLVGIHNMKRGNKDNLRSNVGMHFAVSAQHIYFMISRFLFYIRSIAISSRTTTNIPTNLRQDTTMKQTTLRFEYGLRIRDRDVTFVCMLWYTFEKPLRIASPQDLDHPLHRNLAGYGQHNTHDV